MTTFPQFPNHRLAWGKASWACKFVLSMACLWGVFFAAHAGARLSGASVADNGTTEVTLTIDRDGYYGKIRVNGVLYDFGEALNWQTGGTRSAPRSWTFPVGTSVSLEVVVDDRWDAWVFGGWSDIGFNGEPLSRTIMLDENKSITMYFVPWESETVGGEVVGSGHVDYNPPGQEGPISYWPGTTVTLTAVPDYGWRFQEWIGVSPFPSNSYESSLVFVVSDIPHLPLFYVVFHGLLSVEKSGQGEVLLNDSPLSLPWLDDVPSDDFILEAVPEPGWRFSHWTNAIDGWPVGDENPLELPGHENIVFLYGWAYGITAHFEEETSPSIAYDPTSFTKTCQYDSGISTDTLLVWNGGGGTLYCIIETTPSWLTVAPPASISTGTAQIHTVSIDCTGLDPGDYAGTITLTDPVADNSPSSIPVFLTVVPPNPSYAILQPSGGESFYPGNTMAIEWTCADSWPGDSCYLSLRGPEWRGWGQSPCQNGLNSAQKTLPLNLTPGTYVLRISWMQDMSVWAESAPFEVRGIPTCTIISPCGCDDLQAATQAIVEWECTNNPDGDRMYLSLRGPEWRGWAPVDCADGANSVTKWIPADLTPGSYRLRISWMRDFSVWWESGPFTVVPPPSFTITAPSGGETWQAATQVGVQWDCSNNPTSDDLYLSLRGPEWRGWKTVACTNGSNSALAWIPANLTPGTYHVRLSWKKNYSIYEESESITVVPHPTCTFTNPAGGETWQAGTEVGLSWGCSSNPSADQMYLSLRGPEWRGWKTVACTDGPNSTTAWVPADLSPGTYRVRISWLRNFSVWFESDPITVVP